MADKYFTVMLVPEKSDRVRKITIPTLYMRVATLGALILVLAGVYIFFDYIHVLSQVAENKRLRGENHVLRMDVQAAKNRLDSLDQSVGRLKSFAQKLRIIGNLDSVQGNKLLTEPDPSASGSSTPGSDSEDSGTIEDPEKSGSIPPPKDEQLARKTDDSSRSMPSADSDSYMEHTRSMSLLEGEAAPRFESQTLLDQINQISQTAARLREAAELEENNYALLSELIQERVDRLLATPSIIPTRGYVSSEYGYRYNPFSGNRTFHAGMDIANRIGTKIYAPADGLVTFAGNMGGFGTVLRLQHGYGIVTKYGHTHRVLVKMGARVRRGDLIAEIGTSGRSTGPHLHYQVEVKGRTVNPRLFILEDTF
jgi:murein DD-endopeptidase MepM/ murein hydrolase activator NlpD